MGHLSPSVLSTFNNIISISRIVRAFSQAIDRLLNFHITKNILGGVSFDFFQLTIHLAFKFCLIKNILGDAAFEFLIRKIQIILI